MSAERKHSFIIVAFVHDDDGKALENHISFVTLSSWNKVFFLAFFLARPRGFVHTACSTVGSSKLGVSLQA